MRILVSAASRHGATAEIAVEIGKALRAGLPGAAVEVVPPEQVGDVGGYDAVVLGSAVYMGRWLEEARRLVGTQLGPLRNRPVWLFSSGPVGDPAMPDTAAADAVELSGSVGARDHVVFDGRVLRADLGLRERLAVGLVHAAEGDFRDWPAIRAWADGIAATLRVATPG